jgi:hypothetical protein
MSGLQLDDAIDYLARHLLQTILSAGGGLSRSHDVMISLVAAAYWGEQRVSILNLPSADAEPYTRPFYDAAWELCRIGVLRPGEVWPGAGHTSGWFQR